MNSCVLMMKISSLAKKKPLLLSSAMEFVSCWGLLSNDLNALHITTFSNNLKAFSFNISPFMKLICG